MKGTLLSRRHRIGQRSSGPRFSISRLEVLLFLSLWFVYGSLINSSNLEAFNLQQIGVEAIVERQQFYLEGSGVPQLQPRGDLFVYEGHQYAAKQPGQFMLGALVYFPLRALGVSYADNYLLTSALNTFLTTSLLMALAGLLLFRIARASACDRETLWWPLSTALTYGLATTAIVYSGIAHHDAIASSYLVFAFYLAFRLARRQSQPHAGSATLMAWGAGLFAGLAITTSMLASLIVICISVYLFSVCQRRALVFFLVGALVGLLPLFAYNAINFGNSLLLPNVAGGFNDTFFHFDFNNFTAKLWFYVSMLTLYAPVVWVALAGLAFYPRELRREKIMIAAAALLLVLYLCNIESDGDCNYGPRYLLSLMPFACLGVIGFTHLGTRLKKSVATVALVFLGLLSLLINLAGAMRGAMYCAKDYALGSYLSDIVRGQTGVFPLARWLLVPLLVCVGFLVVAVLASRLEKEMESARVMATKTEQD